MLRMLHQRAMAGDADSARVLIQLGDSADRNARRKRHAAKRAKKSRDAAKKSAPTA